MNIGKIFIGRRDWKGWRETEKMRGESNKNALYTHMKTTKSKFNK